MYGGIMGFRATRRLKVGDRYIEAGEDYPEEAVTPSLLSMGWVVGMADGGPKPPQTTRRKKSRGGKRKGEK
jgi:hypothetical protein